MEVLAGAVSHAEDAHAEEQEKEPADATQQMRHSPHMLPEEEDECDNGNERTAGSSCDEEFPEALFVDCVPLVGRWASWQEFEEQLEEYKAATFQHVIKRTSTAILAHVKLPRQNKIPMDAIPKSEFASHSRNENTALIFVFVSQVSILSKTRGVVATIAPTAFLRSWVRAERRGLKK